MANYTEPIKYAISGATVQLFYLIGVSGRNRVRFHLMVREKYAVLPCHL